MQIISAFGTIGWVFKTYMVFLHLNKGLTPHRLYPFVLNCILGKVGSIFDSDIKNISKFVIVSAITSNLFLMELMLKLPDIKVLKCSRCCVLVLFRSFSKILNSLKCLENFSVKYLKKQNSTGSHSYPEFLTFLTKIELLHLLKWSLLRFKCVFELMLLWLITGMFSSLETSFITLLSISSFSLYLSPLGTMFEMIILFFFLSSETLQCLEWDLISLLPRHLMKDHFVSTCNVYKFGLKTHLVDLVESSISIVFAEEKGLTFHD